MLTLELSGEHLLPEPPFRLVHRALVRIFHLSLVHGDSLDDHHRHRAEHLFGPGLVQAPSLLVPSASFQREAVNERTFPARALDLFRLLLRHLGQHHGFIKRPIVFPRRRLHHGGEERLRVE